MPWGQTVGRARYSLNRTGTISGSADRVVLTETKWPVQFSSLSRHHSGNNVEPDGFWTYIGQTIFINLVFFSFWLNFWNIWPNLSKDVFDLQIRVVVQYDDLAKIQVPRHIRAHHRMGRPEGGCKTSYRKTMALYLRFSGASWPRKYNRGDYKIY